MFLTLLIGAVFGYLYWCVSTTPKVQILENYSPFKASKIYSYDNELLTELYIERRDFISHGKIPQHVKNAFIAVEDKRFYNHHGIDVVRIMGALVKNIKKKGYVEGASTITQQLSKMLFLKPEKTITRKIKEIALSIEMERKYTKDEILGFYLNQAYFGTRAYGIEAASQTYFGKSTVDLTVSQAALLATLPKAPSKRSPVKDPEKAIERRNTALRKMLSIGYINDHQFRIAAREKLPETIHGRNYKAPYFIDYIRGLLEGRLGDRLYTAGLKIYTTLDYKMQKSAERAVEKGIDELNKRGVNGVEAAIVAVELRTGRIRAMVGGTGYNETQFNRVTQAMRQPGSAFKPIVYLTALNQGFSPDDIIDDVKFTYIREEGIWMPQNYDNVYVGKVSLKRALTRSLNAATVHLAKRIGIDKIIGTAKKLGITSTIHPFDSTALGASELTLMEIVYAYGTINNGYLIKPVCVDKIIDHENLSIFEPFIQEERVIEEDVVAAMKHMLRSVITEGTARKATVIERTIYGKTGTTNEHADAWFIGFDDTIAAGVWIGRDDGSTIGNKESGASAALPIWIEFMKSIDMNNGRSKKSVLAKK